MKTYIPRQGSVPARLLEHLSMENPGTIMRPADIAEALGVPKNNVSACLNCAVKSGALVRDRKGWRLPDNAVAQVDTTNHTVHTGEIWGGATQPAFPAAPPRAGDPPPKVRKMRILKEVAAEFHADIEQRNAAAAGDLSIGIFSAGRVTVHGFSLTEDKTGAVFNRQQLQQLVRLVTEPFVSLEAAA